MSTEQKQIVGSIVNWAFRIVLAICGYLLVDKATDINDNMHLIRNDIMELKLHIQHVEDTHSSAINELSRDISRLDADKQNK